MALYLCSTQRGLYIYISGTGLDIRKVPNLYLDFSVCVFYLYVNEIQKLS